MKRGREWGVMLGGSGLVGLLILGMSVVSGSGGMSVEELTRRAEVIVVGRVVEVGRPAAGASGEQGTGVVVRVEQAFKGEVGLQIRVEVKADMVGVGAGGRFRRGGKELLYLRRSGAGGGWRLLGGGQGRFHIEEETTDGRPVAWRLVGVRGEAWEVEEVLLEELTAEIGASLNSNREEGER